MNKLIAVAQAVVLAMLVSALALGADQVIQYNEAMVGAGHPTLADTINRALLVDHETDGTHSASVIGSSQVTDNSIVNADISSAAAIDATKIGAGGVTSTEFGYIGTLTSDAQTQINTKAPTASPTFTGTVTIPTPFTLGAVSVTPTGTELNYIVGLTSSAQGQIDDKQAGSSTLADVSDGVLTNPLVFNDDVYLKLGTDNDFTVRYKSADGTLVIALDNADAMCTFSKTGGLTCTGEITASQYGSSGTDNTYGINICNSEDPSGADLEGGMMWCNSTDNVSRFRSPDNTTTGTFGLAVAAPATAASFCTPGMFSYDASYVYICRAANTWMRASHATW